MTTESRLKLKIYAAEISGLSYSLERLAAIEPTPYTQDIQDDKFADYQASLNEMIIKVNGILNQHLSAIYND